MSDVSETGSRFERTAARTMGYFRKDLMDEFIAAIGFALFVITFTWAGLWVGLILLAISWFMLSVFRYGEFGDKKWQVIFQFVALIATVLSYFAIGLADHFDLRHLSNGLMAILGLMAIASIASLHHRKGSGYLPLALYFVTLVLAIRLLLSPAVVTAMDQLLITDPSPTVTVMAATGTPASTTEPPTITPRPTVSFTPTPRPAVPPPTPTLAPSPTPGCPPLPLRPKPPGASHQVIEGESISGLAVTYDIEELTLIDANAGSYPSLRAHPECLRADWWLIIPDSSP